MPAHALIQKHLGIANLRSLAQANLKVPVRAPGPRTVTADYVAVLETLLRKALHDARIRKWEYAESSATVHPDLRIVAIVWKRSWVYFAEETCTDDAPIAIEVVMEIAGGHRMEGGSTVTFNGGAKIENGKLILLKCSLGEGIVIQGWRQRVTAGWAWRDLHRMCLDAMARYNQRPLRSLDPQNIANATTQRAAKTIQRAWKSHRARPRPVPFWGTLRPTKKSTKRSVQNQARAAKAHPAVRRR